MATTEIEKLVVTLEARLGKYQSDLSKAQAITNQKLAASEARFAKWSSNLQNTASSAAGGIGTVFAGLGAYLSAHAIVDFINEWNRLDRSIEASSQTFGIALKSTKELVALANDSRVDVEAYAKTYVRAAAAVRDYGFTSNDAAVATSVLAKSLKVGQASASEQASTILQFSQALQKGKLDGDEFRTVMENAGVVQELLAKKLNVTKGVIVHMAGEGKLQLKTLIGALLDGEKDIDRIFRQMPMTIDEAFSVLRNNVVAYLGDADKATGASQALSNAILGVANHLDAVAVAAGAILGSAALRMAAFAAATTAAANPLTLLAAALGALGTAYLTFGDDIKTSDDGVVSLRNSVEGFFEALGDSSAIKTFEKLTSEAFDGAKSKLSSLGDELSDLDSKLGGFGHTLANWASNVATYISDKTGLSSLIENAQRAARNDALQAKADDVNLAFGGAGFSSYLGSTNRRPIENIAPAPGKYERDIDRIKKQTEALKAQMAVIEQTTFAQEKAKVASDLLFTAQQQAAKNGTSVTAAQRIEIEKTAEAYAAASVQAKFLADLQSTRDGIEVARSEISLIGLYGQALDEARTKLSLLNEAKKLGVVITPDMQKQIGQTAAADAAIKHYMQSVQELQDISKDALSGFLNDLREGKSLAESFANVLDKLAAKLIDSGVDKLVTSAAGGLFGGGGGGLGALLGLASGGYVSGPGSGTSDSIPAQLSNGEYVVNAAATKKHKALLDAINSGNVGKFAAGGKVGSVPSVNIPTPVAGGSAPVLNFAPVINAQNATPQAVDKMNSETLPMLEKIARRVTLETLGRSAAAKRLVRT